MHKHTHTKKKPSVFYNYHFPTLRGAKVKKKEISMNGIKILVK